MVSLTIFDSIYDNKTDKRMDYTSFDEFEAILYKLSESTKYPTKKDAPLLSPAIYQPNTTRANDNVRGWGGFGILDIDDYEGDMKDIEAKYDKYRYVCYSTASSTVETPKFRLVFPLTTNVDKDNIKHFWYALNKEIGDIADAQTKDLSRMYYVPAKYKNSFNFIFSHDGETMNPYDLMEKYPYVKPNQTMFDRFPPAIQKALIERKRNELQNTNYSWTSYRDCPFVNKKQVDEYKTISGTGWYSKMYQIMLTTAGNAMSKGYPITPKEIEYICRDLDTETGGWYGKRDLEKEAARAIEFVFKNNI
jgi:hypothetical protein